MVGQKLSESGELVEIKEQLLVGNPRLAAAYTYGYNPALLARRARQLGATLRWLAETNSGASIKVEARGDDAALAAAGTLVAEQLKVGGLKLKQQQKAFVLRKSIRFAIPTSCPGRHAIATCLA